MLTALAEICIMLFLNAFLIIGVYTSCSYTEHPLGVRGEQGADKYGIMNDSKMVLWRFRLWAVNTFGNFWAKPFATCPACMASVHSVLPYVAFCLFTDNYFLLLIYPLYIPTLSGLVKLINSKIE